MGLLWKCHIVCMVEVWAFTKLVDNVCVFFTLNRSFYPSTSNTSSVRADSSTLYRRYTNSVVTKLRHRDTTLPRTQ